MKRILLWGILITAVVALVAVPVFAQGKAAGKKEAAKAEKPKPAAKAEAQTPPQPGMVWANTKSKVYHKEGDQWYGKGKNGKWMTEADAVKEGYKLAGKGAAKKEGAKPEGTAKKKAAKKG